MERRRIWKKKPKAIRAARRKISHAPARKPDNFLENTARRFRELQETIGPATTGGMR